METSDNIADLTAALAKAQGAIKGALKDSSNPHFKSKYADLSSVWEACRKPLSDNGLSVVQLPGECADQMIELTTILAHCSGQWIRQTMTIPLGKVDAQSVGSALTYARRYSLAAFVGVAPEDDDGNAATSAAPNDGQRRDRQRPAVNAGTDEQRSKPAPLQGKHKTRAALRQAAGSIANALSEAADGGVEAYVDQVLLDWEEDIEQIKAEGPADWWSHPDWGLEAQIMKARDRVAEHATA